MEGAVLVTWLIFLGEERTYFGGSLEGYFMVVKFCVFFLRLHYLAFRFRKIPQLYHETHLLSFERPPKKIPSTDGPKKNVTSWEGY